MANACQRAGNQHRREGCREDEAWRIAADHVDDAAIRSYIAAHDADRFGERALDHREALRGAIPVRNPSTAGTVHADRSEERTSELQSPMRTSYTVSCLRNHNSISTYTSRERTGRSTP